MQLGYETVTTIVPDACHLTPCASAAGRAAVPRSPVSNLSRAAVAGRTLLLQQARVRWERSRRPGVTTTIRLPLVRVCPAVERGRTSRAGQRSLARKQDLA